jgi:hypothetical protein
MKKSWIKIRDIAGDHLPNQLSSKTPVRLNDSAEPFAGITEAKVISQSQMLQSSVNAKAQAALFVLPTKAEPR